MKSFKILASALAMAALFFTSCTKEHYEGGIDLTKPGITDLTYGEFKHDSKSITISWSGAKAVAAGATSFSVQLSLDKEGHGVDMYDPSKGLTVQAVSGKTDYSATLNGQKVGDKYYVRVRANYPKSIFSDWVWVCDAAGNPAIYKVGRGFISEGIEFPYVYKVTPTSTGLIIKWDPVDGATKYYVEYKLATASEWKVLEFGPNDKTQTKVDGLPSLTEYNVRAKCETPDGMSDYCDVITVSTRQPGSYPKAMGTADELLSWLEGGVVEVDAGDVFTITEDIDLAGASFSAMDEPLIGTLDGGGHTIKGVTSTLIYQNEGTIKNLTIEGEYKVTGGMPETAAFARVNKGIIEECTSKISVSHAVEADADIFIGGFVCRNEGKLIKCDNEGDVTVTAAAAHGSRVCLGGIASVNSGSMKQCHNKGNVSFTCDNTVHAPAIAGICGFIDGSAEGCINSGAVTLSALYCDGYGDYYETTIGKVSSKAKGATPAVGGIAAYSYSETPSEPILSSCTNEGNVTMKFTAQDKYTTTVERVHAAGVIANPWGLIKDCAHSGVLTVSILTSTGDKSGGTFLTCIGGIGGGDWFPGQPDQAATSYNGCICAGSVNLENFDKAGSYSTAGGIVGWPGAEGSRDNSTTDCIFSGKVTLNGTAKARLGGIHGGSGRVTNCISSGEVRIETGSDLSAAGGISGFSSNGFKITKCTVTGKIASDVISNYGIAGLVGNLGNSANSGGFANCSVACSVINQESSNEHTGMIIGYFNGTSASVPVATPKIKGAITFGGKKTVLTSGNYKNYLVGTLNADANNHPIDATFDSSEWIDPDGDSGSSSGVTLKAPENIAINVMYNYVELTWDPVDGAEWYVVEYKKKTEDDWTKAPQVTEPKCRIEGLDHGTDYSFRIKAFSSVASGYSDSQDGSTMEELILGVPVISGAVPAATSIELSWAAIEKATGYHVQYRAAGAEEEWIDSGDTDKTSYTVSGLKPSSNYEFRVRSLGAGGNEGEYSEAYFAVTLDVPVIDKVVAFFSNIKLEWTADAAATAYAVYVDGKKVADLEATANSYSITGLKKATTYKVAIAVTKDGNSIQSEVSEVKTSDIYQVRKNVSPKHLCIGWDDCSGGTGAANRFYQYEVAKDAAGNDILYSVHTFDGQSSANGSFGSSSWMGKPNGANALPSTRVTFGQLEPSTTYYFRVRTVGSYEVKIGYDGSTKKYGATNGDSEFSEWVPFTTEAKHTLGSNEILFQGFDDVAVQADFVNMAAGQTPRHGGKNATSIPYPWPGSDSSAWAVYPFANNHLFATWGLATKADDGLVYMNEKLPELEGWSYNDQVAPQQGSVKIGNSSAGGFYIQTPALSSALLSDAEKDCTFKFKGCALSTSGAAEGEGFVSILVNGTEVGKINYTTDANADKTMDYKWTDYSLDLKLKNGDKVAIATSSKNRIMVDDISIVTK